ncbi:Zn(II)2Cys6 transcription factor domain-containing protein, partial [Aspergillus ruber CBS 135680]
KSRPSASCIPCRNRKVKCDRLTPCSTCLSRAHPEQCTYTSTDTDRSAMKSAETIADLRRKIRALKMQISDSENSENDGDGEGRVD